MAKGSVNSFSRLIIVVQQNNKAVNALTYAGAHVEYMFTGLAQCRYFFNHTIKQPIGFFVDNFVGQITRVPLGNLFNSLAEWYFTIEIGHCGFYLRVVENHAVRFVAK